MDPLLKERNFGVCEGMDWPTYEALPGFDGFPGTYTPEGGETWADVKGRMRKFYQKFFSEILSREAPKSVPNYLIVSHGGAIIQMMHRILNDYGCPHPETLDR